jgi:hypothetical protein
MLVERDGDTDFVKVLDFGLAKVEVHESGGPSSQVLTRQGSIMGTPGYMAPEQAVGERVDARADLYAIGIVLFEMLTGRRPFAGDPVSVLRQHVLEEMPPLPSGVRDKAGPRVEQLLGRLLAKSPKDRVASAAEVGVELDACLGALTRGEPPPEKQVPAPPPPSGARPAVTVRQPTAVTVRDRPIPAPAVAPPSLGTWLSALWTRVRAQLPQRRSRLLGWWTATVERFRARRRRRRLRALLAIPVELTDRLRAWLARRGLRMTDQQWTLALALATAVILLALVLLLLD